MLRGSINYLADSVAPSLFRTGEVLTRRNRDGSDSGSSGVVVDHRTVPIHDARRSGPPTSEANGFELLDRPSAFAGIDFYDHRPVVERYYDECEAIIRTHTGANFVAAFDHNVRSAEDKASQRRIRDGQEVQGPAHMVHGDYTLTSAPQRLADLAQVPTGNDTYVSRLGNRDTLVPAELEADIGTGARRFAIINLWRSITDHPVTRDALALCDGRSVEPDDLVVFEIHYADRVGENYFARPNDAHRWYTYPDMTRDEALLIKQWDSAGALARSQGRVADRSATGPCTFSFHTAYTDDPPKEDEPARASIEVRCVVVY